MRREKPQGSAYASYHLNNNNDHECDRAKLLDMRKGLPTPIPSFLLPPFANHAFCYNLVPRKPKRADFTGWHSVSQDQSHRLADSY